MDNYNIENSSKELIEFINKKKFTKKNNYKKIIHFFSTCLSKSICEMINKFDHLESKIESIIGGVNMIYHIYFVLIIYTNNIKLTIFLLERAILLYTEFIIMSHDKNLISEIYFIPNINDAISFSFKKTIGTIKLDTISITHKNTIFVKNLCITIRNIYKSYFYDPLVKPRQNSKNKDTGMLFTTFLTIIENELIGSLILVNDHSNYLEILNKINCIINIEPDLYIKIWKIKILLFMFNKEYNFLEDPSKQEFLNIVNINLLKFKITYEKMIDLFFSKLIKFTFQEQTLYNIEDKYSRINNEQHLVNTILSIFTSFTVD